MDQSVDAAGSSHGSGSGHDQLGIQHSVGGGDLRAEDGQLVVTSFVGDNGSDGDLRTGTSGGGDSNQGVDGAGNLADAFVVADGAAELSDNADSLSHVHGGAAAQSDQSGAASFLILGSALVHDGGGGVGQNVQVLSVLQVSVLDDLADLLNNTDSLQATVGNQHDVVRASSLQEVGQLLQSAHTELLRDDETKIFNHRESHPFQKLKDVLLCGFTPSGGLSAYGFSIALINETGKLFPGENIQQEFPSVFGHIVYLVKKKFAAAWQKRVRPVEMQQSGRAYRQESQKYPLFEQENLQNEQAPTFGEPAQESIFFGK